MSASVRCVVSSVDLVVRIEPHDPEATLRRVFVADSVVTYEGDGFLVHRAFPSPAVSMVDPFLLLDEMGPTTYAPGEAKGAGDHPHRGFETVTYVLSGEIEHRDSTGGGGVIGPGDVQWMTAGAGVIHSEMPTSRILSEGGEIHATQLWVNLPRAAKMVPPKYQAVGASEIPQVEVEGLLVRIVAGEIGGAKGPVSPRTPIFYGHLRVDGSADCEVVLSETANSFLYVLKGEVQVGDVRVGAHQVAVAPAGAGRIPLAGAGSPAELLLVAGEPLREPVARLGPFVMNTREEILQAVEDFRAGRLAATPPSA